MTELLLGQDDPAEWALVLSGGKWFFGRIDQNRQRSPEQVAFRETYLMEHTVALQMTERGIAGAMVDVRLFTVAMLAGAVPMVIRHEALLMFGGLDQADQRELMRKLEDVREQCGGIRARRAGLTLEKAMPTVSKH